ncbi:MAG: peptide chain release factor 2 [Dehalococcoidia bacterium]|nr:peptide chain release factor 2 [Dehalococcoidia bacterium]
MSWCDFDIAGEESNIAELEKQASDPDIWKDQRKGKALMLSLNEKKGLVASWQGMEKKASDLLDMVNLSLLEEDESIKEDLGEEVQHLLEQFEKYETRLMLSGEYDGHNAVCAVHAGAGGTESQDWANMILRMYLLWAEKQGYEAELLEVSEGEEAGIKSAYLNIRGDHAYGYLKSEHGVHRLVRLSPFDADHARHTSFAQFEVMPEADEQVDMDIPADELRVDTFKSSGPGGQHMQKTSSAVRITHLPSGITAVCQSQRSQHQNKDAALKILYARLLEADRVKQERERAQLKGERVEAGWGNQIRSYVLHPYKMVKDHRTGFETSRAQDVLDGALDGFISAYLRSKVGE